MLVIIGGARRKCLTCDRDTPSRRMPFYKLSPPPARKHMNIEPFSASSITEPQWFCRPCAKEAVRHGWQYTSSPAAG